MDKFEDIFEDFFDCLEISNESCIEDDWCLKFLQNYEEVKDFEKKADKNIINFNSSSLYGEVYREYFGNSKSENDMRNIKSQFEVFPIPTDYIEDNTLHIDVDGLFRRHSISSFPEVRNLSVQVCGREFEKIKLKINYPMYNNYEKLIVHVDIPHARRIMFAMYSYVNSILHGRRISATIFEIAEDYIEKYKRESIVNRMVPVRKIAQRFFEGEIGSALINKYNNLQKENFLHFENSIEPYIRLEVKKKRQLFHKSTRKDWGIGGDDYTYSHLSDVDKYIC
jgi:hypothetical protein